MRYAAVAGIRIDVDNLDPAQAADLIVDESAG